MYYFYDQIAILFYFKFLKDFTMKLNLFKINFNIGKVIVRYTPWKRKVTIYQIACKFSPEPKARMKNMRCKAFFIYSGGTHSTFRHTYPKSTFFRFKLRRERGTRAEHQEK